MQTDHALAALGALSHAHRLAAFRALVQAGPRGMAVGEIRERLDIPPATLSAHLNTLRAAGMVTDVREGRVIRVSADFARMQALVAYLTENCCGGVPCAAPRAAGSAASTSSRGGSAGPDASPKSSPRTPAPAASRPRGAATRRAR